MSEYNNDSLIPMGLAMALAQNIAAMDYFSGLPLERQLQIVEQTHHINSKEEMQSFVASMAKKSN